MNMRNLMIVAATPVFVTGTQNLMNDAMTWVLFLIPTAAALFCAFKAFCYQAADENERGSTDMPETGSLSKFYGQIP